MSTVEGHPVWFGPDARPLFGWWHAPADGNARGAVILCPPLGRDHSKSYAAFRLLGQGLASAGMAALRFDYDGTGNSAGEPDDPDRLDAWLGSITEAIDLVRRTFDGPLSLVGMTIGATLAVRAAELDGCVDQLVLWDPSPSGRTFLRERSAVSSLSFGVDRVRSDGAVETPGYAFPGAAAGELGKLMISASHAPVARRVLVLPRPHRNVEGSPWSRLGAETVDRMEATGQQELMDMWFPLQKMPCEDLGRIVDWLAKGWPDEAGTIASVPAGGAAAVGRTSGRDIIETTISVPPVGLFGIATQAPGAPDGPVAVFLPVSNEHHGGPERMWVDLARRWAEFGVSSLRVDLSGLGESPLRHPHQAPLEPLAREAWQDLEDIVMLASAQGTRDVILVGLCSGGYLAAEAALNHQLAGIVLINPVFRLLPRSECRDRAMDPRYRVGLPSGGDNYRDPARLRAQDSTATQGYRAVIKEHLHRVTASRGLLGAVAQAVTGWAWRRTVCRRPAVAPGRWLQEIVGRRTDVLVVAGEWERRTFLYGASRRQRRRLAASGQFRFEFVPGLEHSLLITSQRSVVVDTATDHVRDRFGRARAVTTLTHPRSESASIRHDEFSSAV